MIERAKLILAELEAEDRTSHARRLIDDLPLFAAAARAGAPPTGLEEASDAVTAALAALNPDEMSPREAIEALYALKAKREFQAGLTSVTGSAAARSVPAQQQRIPGDADRQAGEQCPPDAQRHDQHADNTRS